MSFYFFLLLYDYRGLRYTSHHHGVEGTVHPRVHFCSHECVKCNEIADEYGRGEKIRMKDDSIVMVAAGSYLEKNAYKEYGVRNLYLNYGLLGLSTKLSDQGFSVRMFQGDDRTPEFLISEIEQNMCMKGQYPVFLSIPSFFHVQWARDFSKQLKERYDVRLVAGGRWVIDRNLSWIKEKIPEVDFFIKGCPDDRMEQFLFEENWKKNRDECRYHVPFSHLDYTILYQYRKYQPVIEVSRGCAGGCSFCLESHYKACKSKAPSVVLDEVEGVCRAYETDSLNFYFEGAIFSPSVSWAEEFQKEYRKRNMKFQFRMQSRADALCPETVGRLSEAGLKVLDIGLESASPIQLERMGKTKNASLYLEKAEHLIEKSGGYGVWNKLNLLFYAGETLQTLQETRNWLAERKNSFKGLSCNPLIVYLNGEDTWNYVEELQRISGQKVDKERLWKYGYTTMDLSDELGEKDVEEVVNSFYREFMTKEDYVELKQVTYTARQE